MDTEAWYIRYGESVYRRCLRLCRDEHHARDLTQEVFLRAHRFGDGYRGTAGPLTWLFTLASHCFFDSVRKPQPVLLEEVYGLLAYEREGAEQTFCNHDLVVRLLTHCAEDVRAIVIHRYFDELDLAAIAKLQGLNERTVRRKLQHFLESAERLVRGAA